MMGKKGVEEEGKKMWVEEEEVEVMVAQKEKEEVHLEYYCTAMNYQENYCRN
jgi:hypothetical protein